MTEGGRERERGRGRERGRAGTKFSWQALLSGMCHALLPVIRFLLLLQMR